MIKLIGAAMIAAACALGCASVLKEQWGRVRELRSLCTALSMMHREMSLNLTALPELSKKLSECCDDPAAGFFRMTWLMWITLMKSFGIKPENCVGGCIVLQSVRDVIVQITVI